MLGNLAQLRRDYIDKMYIPPAATQAEIEAEEAAREERAAEVAKANGRRVEEAFAFVDAMREARAQGRDTSTVPRPPHWRKSFWFLEPSTAQAQDAEPKKWIERRDPPSPGSRVKPSQPAEPVAPAKPRFDLANRTAANLFKGQPPAQSWLVEGIFPAGKLAVLASPPGIGKSYLALDLARKAAGRYNGDHPAVAFGAVVRGFGRTVYISAEDDQEELHRRLHSLVDGGAMPDRLHVLSLPDVGHFGVIELNTDAKAMQPTAAWVELVEEIKNLPDVKLVVLDTLQALSTGDTNDAAAVQPLMNQCTELAVATGATVLLIHHVGKGSTKDIKTALDAADAIRGSGAITGSARAAYVLWPASATEGRKVCATLDVKYEENAVVMGMVAKANGASRRDRTYFLRDESGLLRDVTQLYYASGGDDTAAMQADLLDAIGSAWGKDDAFTFTGDNSLYSRRHELPDAFHEKPRKWFEEAIGALQGAGMCARVLQNGRPKLAPAGAANSENEP